MLMHFANMSFSLCTNVLAIFDFAISFIYLVYKYIGETNFHDTFDVGNPFAFDKVIRFQ